MKDQNLVTTAAISDKLITMTDLNKAHNYSL